MTTARPRSQSPLLIVSLVISVLVVLLTILDTVTHTVALGDLLIPGVVAGLIAAALGVLAKSPRHIVLGIGAAVFPLLWFLILVKLFGFV